MTMKKLIVYIALFAIFSGCEDVLDKRELNAVDADDVWNSETLTNLYLNKVYVDLLPSFGGASSTEISDESVGTGTGNMMYGELSDEAAYGNFSSSAYNDIRELNILFSEIDKGSINVEARNLLKGQAYFLRAWAYWELVKYYGGVPLVLEPQDPFFYESLLVKRSPAKACIEQIISDLDNAIALLPSQWPASERGRITRGAAAALKGRVLLFYASPQFNPSNLQERWEAAYQANKEAKDLCLADGYALYNSFEKIFIDESKTSEAIFITVYDNINRTNSYENSVRPRSESNDQNAVSNAPNWDFVKSFPMKDGKSIVNHPEYDSLYYWKNRDPRFYSTIAYNGCGWELSGKKGRRQWTYTGNKTEPSSTTTGASPTGFYCRKNVNPAIISTETVRTPTDWIEIRLAEVLLNLAECAAELNKLDEAKAELITIRQRAGIESGSDGSYGITAATREEMIEAVMLERKIELAFENKRHWDMRRRNMFVTNLYNIPKLNGTRRHGIETLLDTSLIRSFLGPEVSNDSLFRHFELIMSDTIDFDTDYTKYFTTTFNVEIDQRDINFLQPKYNFYFMPKSELEKNPNLQQTIYWGEVNPFDPLAE
jgi:hypothetical protein